MKTKNNRNFFHSPESKHSKKGSRQKTKSFFVQKLFFMQLRIQKQPEETAELLEICILLKIGTISNT